MGMNLVQSMQAKEIRKFVGMEQGIHPLPPNEKTLPFPPAVLLTDGTNGGWIDGLEGLKVCYPIFEPEESVSPVNMGCKDALVARILGCTKWVHTG